MVKAFGFAFMVLIALMGRLKPPLHITQMHYPYVGAILIALKHTSHLHYTKQLLALRSRVLSHIVFRGLLQYQRLCSRPV